MDTFTREEFALFKKRYVTERNDIGALIPYTLASVGKVRPYSQDRYRDRYFYLQFDIGEDKEVSWWWSRS